MKNRVDVRSAARGWRKATVVSLALALCGAACATSGAPEPSAGGREEGARQQLSVERPVADEAQVAQTQARPAPATAPAAEAVRRVEEEAAAESRALAPADKGVAVPAGAIGQGSAARKTSSSYGVPGRGRPQRYSERAMDDLLENAMAAPSAPKARVRKRKMEVAAPLSTVTATARPVHNTEAYAHITERPFSQVSDAPLSTFSVDVDTASYANVRRMLRDGQRPTPDAVRIEEFINYFDYDYPEPDGDAPFSIYTETASAPWNPSHRLVHIGLRGRSVADEAIPARNLVFLLDVSGSMNSADKLPLLKRGMLMLSQQMRAEDRVSIVVYAGASGVVLPATRGDAQHVIREALERLEAGGSTNGAGGIELAYRIAQENFVKGGINRVILATDGDFNVGTTSQGALQRLIEEKRESGVFLTVLGFGRGNLKDSTMETLADKGNGHYAYIDSDAEAHKVLVREAGSTLVTLAKDVKLQVEWNPEQVESYRLIGYENRALAARDFNDDKKDAGEIGAGHTVTALYEVVLRGGQVAAPGEIDPLKYQQGRTPSAAAKSGELLTVKFRYKAPDENRSRLLQRALVDSGTDVSHSSETFRFAAAVAGFGMILRGSEYRGDANLPGMQKLASSALGHDPHGDKHGLLELMSQAARLGIDG